MQSQVRLVFLLTDTDGDGYISREELHAFTALCLDARLIRPSLAKQLDWMRRKYLEHFGIVT